MSYKWHVYDIRQRIYDTMCFKKHVVALYDMRYTCTCSYIYLFTLWLPEDTKWMNDIPFLKRVHILILSQKKIVQLKALQGLKFVKYRASYGSPKILQLVHN